MLVGCQGEGSEPAESRQRVWCGSLSYHGVGAQSSVSRAHLLYLRHQGLEQRVGGGRGGAGGGDVFVGGGAPHALLAALGRHRAGTALQGHTRTAQHTLFSSFTAVDNYPKTINV